MRGGFCWLLCAGLVLALGGCNTDALEVGAPVTAARAEALAPVRPPPGPYVLRLNDTVRVRIYNEPELSGDYVVDSGRKRVLRREAIVDRNDLDFGQVCNRDTFNQRSGVGIESAAVKIDQHTIALRSGQRRDDVGANAANAGFLDVHRIKFARLIGVHLAPGIGMRPPFGKRLRRPYSLLIE